MIARGFVRVTELGALLTVLTHGDFFGEATLLSDDPSRATVQAITLCQFTVLEKEDFDELQAPPRTIRTSTSTLAPCSVVTASGTLPAQSWQ